MAENKVGVAQGITTERGRWTYDGASESGHVEIELPTLPGSPNPVERMHARQFGPFVAGKVASALTAQPYLRQQSPAATFWHYVGAAKGSGLMDRAAIGRMETLAKEFEAEPEQQEYFKQVIRPWLHSLTPKRRQT